jgi:hypothetical protein
VSSAGLSKSAKKSKSLVLLTRKRPSAPASKCSANCSTKVGRQRRHRLRGTKREVQRGQVLCKPGSIKPHTHFTGEIYVLSKDEGGRHTPFFNNYRPQFYFRDGRDWCDRVARRQEMVMPGDNVSITVKLINPIAMEEGLRFAIREAAVPLVLALLPKSSRNSSKHWYHATKQKIRIRLKAFDYN